MKKLTQVELATVLDWAKSGNRVVADDKVVWKGLGNRSGLHAFQWEYISETWKAAGKRFENKIKKLEFNEIQLQQFHNINRDRGRWAVHHRIGGHSGHNGFPQNVNGH